VHGGSARQILVPFQLAKSAPSVRVHAGGSDTPLRSDADLLLEQVVDRLRIGLAARCLHHLADEP
jgi:hypothetical protein